MSIIAVIEEYTEKVEELENYIALIKSIEANSITVLKENLTNGKSSAEIIDLITNEDLQKTLKASFFLLVYNLIESTMRSGIEVIYDHISLESVNFNELNTTFRKRILKDAKKNHISAEDLHLKTSLCIEKEIIKASYRSEQLFSGNIDHQLIVKLAEQYGFSYSTEYEATKHGENLKHVKRNRNDLAHGNVTFREVGRNYTSTQLEKIQKEVVNYLETILKNIKVYLDDKNYLDKSSGSAIASSSAPEATEL